MPNNITADNIMNILHGGENVSRVFIDSFPELVCEFIDLYIESYRKFNLFEIHNDPNERVLNTGKFVFLSLDAIFTSTHLLLMGYLIPSGNMFRQSIESLSMAALLSENKMIEVKKNKNWSRRDFFKDFLGNQKYTRSHNSLAWLERNSVEMGLKKDSVEIFKKSKQFYNSYSHPSLFSLGARMIGGDSPGFLIGNAYDVEKFEFYQKEMQGRLSYLRCMPSAIEVIYGRAKNN